MIPWYLKNARDLPWRRTHDPYAVWVSEIMLQQTQVKTVIPFWNRWMKELPTIEAAAKAPSSKIHKLWEGLGYYTRVRNLQKAAQVIAAVRRDEFHESPLKKRRGRDSQRSSLRFPETFDAVLALPGIGRYTAGAICSIAFNQPTPILDGNVIRVLTRIFGIAENPKEKETNARLWELAEELVLASRLNCSHLNQSLMELGALVCTPRNPQCLVCPVQKLCVAFHENLTEELPNLGKRAAAAARHFLAFAIERDGKFLVRQRPAGILNAHLWEFPNVEVADAKAEALKVFNSQFGFNAPVISPLCMVKHSITRYRITLEAFAVSSKKFPAKTDGAWKTPTQMQALAFTSAHKKVLGSIRL
ncbi:MAG TPA: A/G-specific adenine glycosylase [Verrucomicrobiae bacterium]